MRTSNLTKPVSAGPVSAGLRAVGPVYAVPWARLGEMSQSGHRLVKVIAKARVKQQNLAWGRGEELEKGDLVRETAYARRRLSVASVIAFGQRLARRVSQVGGQNAALAGGRRQQWRREERAGGVMAGEGLGQGGCNEGEILEKIENRM